MEPGTHASPSPPQAGTGAAPADQDRPGDGPRRRLLWLIALRPLLVGVILGAGLFVESPPPKGLPREFAIYLLETVAALSVLYLASRRVHSRYPWLIEAQLVIDVSVVTSIVILTGGFHSDFVALYVLPILGGSVLRLSRGGMTIALWSGISFGMIVASQYGLVIPRPEHWGLTNAILPLPPPRYAFYSVSVHIIAFIAVARLTGYLAQSLHRSDQNLRAASSAIADLQAVAPTWQKAPGPYPTRHCHSTLGSWGSPSNRRRHPRSLVRQEHQLRKRSNAYVGRPLPTKPRFVIKLSPKWLKVHLTTKETTR